MKKYIIYALFALLWVSCKNDLTKKDGDKIKVVTTTQMIADVARNIGGQYVDVESLMGPGIDPHFYKATQGDLQKLNGADIILYNGLHLEGKMQDVFERFAKSKNVLAVTKDIPRSELIVTSSKANDTIFDPHVWHSIPLWQYTIEPIVTALCKLDTAHARFYKENAKAYKAKLLTLNDEVTNEVASIAPQQRLLITSHDAFNYFGRSYNIEVRGLQGISTISEIGIRDITQMVELLISRKVKAVFVESSVNEKNLRAVIAGCKDKGHVVKIGGTLFSDAMGADDKPEGSYLGMIKYNTQTIVAGLK